MTDLFPLLVNRLNHDEQMFPKYIGRFDGVASLPHGVYPPIYWWEDTSIGKVRLSFNDPLLEEICIQEAGAGDADIGNGDNAIAEAIEKLHSVSTSAFDATLQNLGSLK